MYYILFIIYLVFFCFLVPRLPFIKKSGLASSTIIGLFLLKVFAGVIYGWMDAQYLKSGDTFLFFNNSVKETDLLFSNPLEYFKTFFISSYNSYGNFFGSSNSFWNDLRGTLLEKLLSIFNIFSFTNYYIDSLFFNVLTFFGVIALYRVFIKISPKNSWAIIAGLFFIPSAIYYSSGIHKDGLVFLGIAVSIFNLYQIMVSKNKSAVNYVFLVAGLLLVLLIRNFFFFAILPAFVCWVVATKYPKKTILIFFTGYCITGLLFFTSPLLHPSLNFPAKVSDRQHAFLQMKWARSYIPTDSLQPNIVSFIKKTPEALNHVLLRPYLTETYTLFYTAAGIEVALLILLILLFILFKKPFTRPISPFLIFCIFFSFSCLLIIGYTIPITGAIVRYRSVFLPLLFTPMLCNMDWNKIKNIILK